MDQPTAQQPTASTPSEKPKKKRATAEDKRQEVLGKLRQRAKERGEEQLSREQRLAIRIADMPEKSKKDREMLCTILDAERAAILARRKKANAAKIYQDEAEKERRARNKRLIEFGGLVDIAEVGDYDRETLLGALASIPELTERERESMRQRGSKIVSEREAAKAVEKERKEAEKAPKEADAQETKPQLDRYGNLIGK